MKTQDRLNHHSVDAIGISEHEARRSRNNSSSLRRALDILDAIAAGTMRSGGISLTDISNEVGFSKSTVVRLLAPLMEYGLVARDEVTQLYALGSTTLQFGSMYLGGLDMPSIAARVLARLSEQTGETAHLVVRDDLEVIYVDKVESARTIRLRSRVGDRRPLYSTSVGKAILAYCDSGVVEKVGAAPMRAFTPRTITTIEALQAELEKIRAVGYAVDNMENEPDVRCVGAPIFNNSHHPFAALSISGPASRLTRDRAARYGVMVRATADEISLRIGAHLRGKLRWG